MSTLATVFALCIAVTLAVPASQPHLRQKRVYSTNVLPSFKRGNPQLFPPGLGAKHANRMVVLDIGANNGDSYTLKAAQEGHPVIAFEPSPVVAPLFKKVMSDHKLTYHVYNFTSDHPLEPLSADKSPRLSSSAVYLIPVALSNATTILNFHQSPCSDLRKCGKINHLDPTSKSKTAVKVPVYRLDDVPLPADPSNIWFMKIDVEGYELQVLKGARKLIKQAKIPYIGIEFAAHGKQGTKWGVDLLEELYLQGYSCHHLRGFGKCHDREFRSPSLKCNYPFSLDDWKTAPTFEEYAETFELRSDRHKKASLADLMCIRHGLQ
ncbi:FkbM family methyltransferase [Gracilaria domingensis]|nr:FkbM family methyltransferase [Gracilaria domingensis]